MNPFLWGSTLLLVIIAVLWLRVIKHEILHLPSALHLLLCITASTILTQYALMAEHNPPIIHPINGLPALSLLYLGIHYILVIRLVFDHVLPSLFRLSTLWLMLFLYPSYLYFRTFFALEYGTPYPLLYAIALLLILDRKMCSNTYASSYPSSNQTVIFPHGLLLSLTTFLLLSGVSTVLSATPGESLGEYFQIVCFALLPFLLARDLVDEKVWRTATAWIVILGGLIWVVLAGIKFGLLTSDLGLPQALHYRLFIANVGPNLISYPLVTLLPLCIGMGLIAADRWRKMAFYVGCGGMVLAIASTQANLGYSGWIGLLLGVVTMVLLLKWTSLKTWWESHPRMHPTIIVSSIGLIVVIILGVIGIASRVNNYSFYTRLYGWRTLLYQVADHPLFGSGLGVRQITAQYGNRVSWDNIGASSDWLIQEPLNQQAQQLQLGYHTHNIFLEITVGAGVPALISYLWFIWALGKYSYSAFRRATGDDRILIAGCIAGIAASFGWGLIDVMEFSPPFFTTPVWLLIGLLLASPRAFDLQSANG